MFCKYCGMEISDNALFCSHCGRSVTKNTLKPEKKGILRFDSNPDTPDEIRRDSIVHSGQSVTSRYKFISMIGRGGMGEVWKVHDFELDMIVVLKKIYPDLWYNEYALESLKREVKLSYELNNQNIINIKELVDIDGKKFLKMEYVDGVDLRKLLYKKERLSEAEVIRIMTQVANGMEYAHKNNVLHRDLKPENIMIAKHGTVKIMDLGLAVKLRQLLIRYSKAKIDSSGPQPYISMEQTNGMPVKQSDIWSVGVIMYECLSGKLPFEALTDSALIHQIETKSPSRFPGVSDKMWQIISKCLEKNPENRFQTFGELKQALQASNKKVEPINNIKTSLKNEKTLKNYIDPIIQMEFVYVEGGEYMMGCVPGDTNCESDEKPRHKVRVDSFYIGKYPVTVGQYRQFVKESGYDENEEWRKPRFKQTDNHPVVNVSWYDAQKFCDWLSAKSGKRFRLPTEAEWEYAARDRGEDKIYPWGNSEPNENKCNFDDIYERTTLVNKFLPNKLGIYDMSGNVYEWCLDWYDRYYYNNSPVNNTQSPDKGTDRVIRGGGWFDSARYCRLAYRYRFRAGWRYDDVGFRLVRTK